MPTPHDQDKAGGNSSFGNTQRPADIQGDKPENQRVPHDPAHPEGSKDLPPHVDRTDAAQPLKPI
jgi:hypothetical protein